MLWYKAWAESRARFMIALVVMTLGSVFVIGWQNANRDLFRGPYRTLYIVFVLVLGMGGVVRERELGTAPFTLALPVSRIRLTVVRATIGLAELSVLAFVPSVVLSAASFVMTPSLLTGPAVALSLRWILGGSALFALAFFASTVLTGEYTPFVAALTCFFFHTVTIQFVRFARPATIPYLFTLQEVMSGIRPSTPAIAAIVAGAGLTMIAAAARWADGLDC